MPYLFSLGLLAVKDEFMPQIKVEVIFVLHDIVSRGFVLTVASHVVLLILQFVCWR